MKVAIILLIAVLACASARVIQSEVYTGFTNKLGFTETQHKQLQACAMEVTVTAQKYLAPGKSALKSQAIAFLFAEDAKHREAILAVEHYLQTALPACRTFVGSVASIFAKGSTTPEEQQNAHGKILHYRLAMHGTTIMSTLVSIVDDAKAGKSVQVGEKLAYIVQILSGLTHPETIIEYMKNYKQPIEVQVMETDNFIQQTINAAAKELGHTEEVSVQRVKELREAVQQFVVLHMGIQMQLHKATSFVERQVIILGAVRDLVKVAAVVGENVKLVLTPYVKNIHGNPKANALRVIHNYYLNLPTLQHKMIDIGTGIHAHHPVQTGKAIAGFVKALTQ